MVQGDAVFSREGNLWLFLARFIHNPAAKTEQVKSPSLIKPQCPQCIICRGQNKASETLLFCFRNCLFQKYRADALTFMQAVQRKDLQSII